VHDTAATRGQYLALSKSSYHYYFLKIHYALVVEIPRARVKLKTFAGMATIVLPVNAK